MTDMTGKLERTTRWLAGNRGMILPVAAAAMIFVILVPVPAMLMDAMLLGSIALAAIILLTTIHVPTPLEFNVFPSVLLGATMLRLVLCIAATRLILTGGADGRGVQEAQLAAGRVIWTFSHFVTAGSLAVGVILFLTILIVQFVVVTRGASRISEVAARFVLDAMPGKQMAIDADLNAGLIRDQEARRRRAEVAQEADFYGAMDGASKFIRGDAIAALLIVIVNILGGLYVGMVRYGWGAGETANLFVRLAIGNGLAAQVPALVVSVSAALLVSRGTRRTNLSKEVIGQLTGRPVVLAIAAAFLAALMLTSLPKAPLFMLGVGCAGLAWIFSRRRSSEQDGDGEVEAPVQADTAMEELPPVDTMRIELGFSLLRLVGEDRQGDLLARIAALRREVAEELGFLTPAVKIRDNMRLDPHSYAVMIRGAKVASGRLYPAQLLAIATANVKGRLIGRQSEDPAFGSPAVWISPTQRDRAEMMGYTVVEPADVLLTHLGQIIRRHAAELLSRRQVVGLLDNLRTTAPDLVKEVTDKLRVGHIQQVLQNLLGERVSIRDLETVLEALGEAAARTDRMDVQIEQVRGRLARTLTQHYCCDDGKLWCVSLDADLEDSFAACAGRDDGAGAACVPPELATRITDAVVGGLSRLQAQGRPQVVLCSPSVRAGIRELIVSSAPEAAVLAYNEVESAEVQSVASIGIEQ